jgi:hypothetical protein
MLWKLILGVILALSRAASILASGAQLAASGENKILLVNFIALYYLSHFV